MKELIECKDKVLKENIKFVKACDCSICGTEIRYRIINDDIYFDSNCDCNRDYNMYYSELQIKIWSELYNFMNNDNL